MANNRQLWFVFPLDLKGDSNSPLFAQANGEFAQEVRVDGRGRLVPPRDLEPIEYGFKIASNHREDMMKAFTSYKSAQLYVKETAEKHPKTMYGIYSCIGVYETTVPTIIEKKFNDAGELVPAGV